MNQIVKFIYVTITLLLTVGCTTFESKHQPQFSKNDWIDDLSPFHPKNTNEWSTIDLGLPQENDSVFRFDPESTMQDFLDLK